MECRAAPGEAHNKDCGSTSPRVPWEVQKFMYDELVCTAMQKVYKLLYDDDGVITDLGRKRLQSGHKEYGDQMYRWTPGERLGAVLEELADAIVYLTSGPIE